MYLLNFEFTAFINNKLLVFFVLSFEREITTPAAVNNKVILPSNCRQAMLKLYPQFLSANVHIPIIYIACITKYLPYSRIRHCVLL